MALNLVTTKVRGFPDYHATSFEDFENWVLATGQPAGLRLFRGQNEAWPLLPTIARHTGSSPVLQLERQALRRFKEDARRTMQKAPRSDWDWLVVAQHHGLPTRLLDWTADPLAALWFALHGATTASEPEVWALVPDRQDVVTNLAKGSPFSGGRTKVFRSNFVHPRLNAQQSWFVCFRFLNVPSLPFVRLERNQVLRQRLQRIRLGSYALARFQAALHQKGYSARKMFPDTQDVATAVRREVFDI